MTKVLTMEARQLIIKAVTGKVNKPCPKCGGNNFNGQDNLINLPFVTLINDHCDPVGKVLPAYPLACNNCGYVELYSLGCYGLMDIFSRLGNALYTEVNS